MAMHIQFEILILICGCIGAAAPEIVRLYKLRHRPAEFPKSYFLISALFFFLGGFVALILPAVTLWGAFYVGASLPTIVSAAASKKPKIVQELSEGGPPFKLAPSTWREYLGCLFA